MKDLDIIKKLELEIGHSLKRMKNNNIGSRAGLGYVLHGGRKVIGIRLDNIPLNHFPKTLFEFTQLEQLSIYQSNLKEIPLEFSKLKNLKSLTLAGNDFKKFPESILELKELERLNLKDCGISHIPQAIDKLEKLEILHLFSNSITSIPETLFKSGCLKELYLSSNRISSLPNPISNLKNLEVLDLGDNKIGSIPETINELKNLKWLGLYKNKIKELPHNILELQLEVSWEYITRDTDGFIILEGNPFDNPSPEIIMQGNKALEEYFEQRRKTGKELLNEAKLILLGDGRSGKTSLANRLLGKELPKEGDRTQGVDIVIGEYSFRLANGKEFKINIWDFAGQDKYKTLHQLFYTESSVYVMVAESGNTSIDYDDWFQTAALFGEGSPLVLVLNEFKEGIGMGSFDSNYWKKQFPELLKEVFTVNLGTKQNLVNAEECIQYLAQTLPHTKYTFPSNWAAIRRILNGRRNEQYITLQEYLKICKDNNLPERESGLILSSVLHKVGDCLHYQKSELLKQYIILKNEWATDAVYKVLDDKIVAEQKCGFFDRSDTERIWCSVEYSDMRPQLLELMKQFKLAYQLPGKEEFVTPPLLPPAAPTGFSWPDGDALELYIEYEFLPKALLTQFIVTRHADIAAGRTLVWRHGVILKWDDEAIAEVSKVKLQGRDAFRIRTQGSNRKGMMTVILKTFRQLHADYKGIKYKEKVPCICEGCRSGKNKQHYFDFANLQFRLEKGRNAECDNSLQEVNVLELLENTFVFEKFKEGQALRLKQNVVRESSPEIRILNMFLASSNELIDEREKIEQALSRKNKSLRKRGFLVELLIWEDGKHIGKSLRSQDDYNLEIEQCNLFTMLFYSKVGKYSLEEFDKAKSLFDKGKMPRMRIFQKNNDLPKNSSKDDSDSRFEFLERLKKLEHFPILFDNPDKLIRDVEDTIDKLLLDEEFVSQLKTE